ncbi:MAG: Segregation and condensation protein B [Candidatus Dichloromethanomonas elyunquensis]|nr:MAG: Segregation and condensation protein B [Candidatus Dichloromethanomonas elyunquensis]
MLFQETEIAALEALLFMAKEPLQVHKLAEILEISSDNVIELAEVLKERYASPSSGFILIELKNGYRLGTKPEIARYIEVLYKQPSQMLSNAALEVLSIVAYKQPITRGEIDFIRGVQSDRAIATLAEKGLVREIGRKDGPGRPILYGTTEEFLIHFGIKSLHELPELGEFKDTETEGSEEKKQNILKTEQ